MRLSIVLGVGVTLAALAGCRGNTSADPPLHLAPDMDWQPHRRAQSHSPVFADTRAMRPIDQHTVAHGSTPAERAKRLKEDDAFFRGVDRAGKPLRRMPVAVDAALLDRGEERYNIYCTPCHDAAGTGNGIVSQRSGGAFAGMPSFTKDVLVNAPDGELFQTITSGKGRMPAYAAQVPEADRWAIVAWLRVLQTSQAGRVEQLTDEERRKLKPAEKVPGAATGGAQ